MRCIGRQLRTRFGDAGVHDVQDLLPGLSGTSQGLDDDLVAQPGDLDVKLDRRDPLTCAGYLKVHVPEMVLKPLDVRQYGPALPLGDHAHGDAGHRRPQRDAGIKQRQRAGTGAGHRGRAVGREHLRHHANRVGKLVFARQHWHQSAFRQRPMADLSAARPPQGIGLARRVGWKVVVVHVALGGVPAQRLNHLLI